MTGETQFSPELAKPIQPAPELKVNQPSKLETHNRPPTQERPKQSWFNRIRNLIPVKPRQALELEAKVTLNESTTTTEKASPAINTELKANEEDLPSKTNPDTTSAYSTADQHTDVNATDKKTEDISNEDYQKQTKEETDETTEEEKSPFESDAFMELYPKHMARLINTIKDKKIDTVFFLDKSARPLQWLLRDTWANLYPKDKIPDIRFINIGTEKEGESVPTGKTLDELRDIFHFQGNTLVVDEIVSSGRSIGNAISTLHTINPSVELTPFNMDINLHGIDTGLKERDDTPVEDTMSKKYSQETLQYLVRDRNEEEKKDKKEAVESGAGFDYREVFKRISQHVISKIQSDHLLETTLPSTGIDQYVQDRIDSIRSLNS